MSYRVYWYSWQDRRLRRFNEQGSLATLSSRVLPTALLLLLARSLKDKKPLFVCFAYPYGCHGFEYPISLFLLAIFRISRLVQMITDYFDPPIESKLTFEGKMSSRFYLWSTVKDFLSL